MKETSGERRISSCTLTLERLLIVFVMTPILVLLISMQVKAAAFSGIEAALRATLSQHPALAGKRAEVRAKEFAGDSARAQRYPTISGQLSAQHTNNYPIGIRARQPLWAFGRIDNGIAYADADVGVETVDLLRVKRQLIDETVVAYARILGINDRLKVSVDNEAALDKMYRQIRRRKAGQLASRADVRLARARLLQAQAHQNRLKSDLLVAENELLSLTQFPVEAKMQVSEALTNLPRADVIAALAQDQSADIRLKIKSIELARREVEREKSAPMPSIYLQADYFYDDQAAGTSDVRIGVTIDANLEGMGFAAYGRNNAAGARLQAVKAGLNTARNEVKRMVNSLYTNRQAQQLIVESQISSVEELSEILLSYQRQYEAGQKTWLEILNMQRELTEQRHQLMQAKNEWLIYSLKLMAMTGDLDTMAGEKEQTNDEPN